MAKLYRVTAQFGDHEGKLCEFVKFDIDQATGQETAWFKLQDSYMIGCYKETIDLYFIPEGRRYKKVKNVPAI